MKNKQTIKFEKQLSGRRYYELLNMSGKMLETSLVIKEHFNNAHTICDSRVKQLLKALPSPSQCHMAGLDYAVSALEAFINHIGYIYCNDWVSGGNERSGFWDKYKEMMLYLQDNMIDVEPSILTTPYLNFENERSIRNNIHHPHASKHDYYYTEGYLIENIKDAQEDLQILFETWVSVSYDQAKLSHESVKSFINYIYGLIKESSLLPKIKAPDLTARQKLHHDFMSDPFKITIVTCKTSLVI